MRSLSRSSELFRALSCFGFTSSSRSSVGLAPKTKRAERIAPAPMRVRTAPAIADPPFRCAIPSSLRICLMSCDRRRSAETRAYSLLPRIRDPRRPELSSPRAGVVQRIALLLLRKSSIRPMTPSGSSPRASARFACIQSRSDWGKSRWTSPRCEGEPRLPWP